MLSINPRKARKFFEAKLDFTTGPQELNNMLKNHEEFNLIDVRRPEDYQMGHIPFAINLPKEKWDNFEALEKDKPNIIYCYSEACHLAANAAYYFAENGYPVMELEGGFDTWQHNNLPIET